MRSRIRGLLALVLVFFAGFGLTFVWSEIFGQPVEAKVIEESVDSSCSNSMLGLRPWYKGLVQKMVGRVMLERLLLMEMVIRTLRDLCG